MRIVVRKIVFGIPITLVSAVSGYLLFSLISTVLPIAGYIWLAALFILGGGTIGVLFIKKNKIHPFWSLLITIFVFVVLFVATMHATYGHNFSHFF